MKVEIPESLARELSDLLTKQTIRMQVLTSIVGKPEYETMEAELIPIQQRIDAIKYTITEDYIPDEYRSDEYQWNFNGFMIDRNTIEISRV